MRHAAPQQEDLLENPTPSIVYVVDDDEAVRDSMRALLESYGIEVCAYASAREFLVAGPVQPRGCMLLDLHMPGMSGLELLDMLHSRGSKLPVIAVTGRSDSVLKERVVRAGATTLLDKPIADELLLSSLACALSLAECRGC
jgi:two-component system, LuxR family, response regulator FixJ